MNPKKNPFCSHGQKVQVSFTDHQISVVRLSVRPSVCLFVFLTSLEPFEQIELITNHSYGKGIFNLFKLYPFQEGDNKKPSRNRVYILNFYSQELLYQKYLINIKFKALVLKFMKEWPVSQVWRGQKFKIEKS